MNIANDIRALLVARLDASSPVEILRIASSLAANEQIEAISAGHAMRATPRTELPRFTKVSAAGRALSASATEWEGVFDSKTNLIWSRRLLTGGERNWKDAIKACSEIKLCGEAARAPTVEERLSIVDYSRHSPALDTSFFDASEKSAYEWTSTPDASSPSDYAWFVGLGFGYCSRYGQSYRGYVRAVRAGQPEF